MRQMVNTHLPTVNTHLLSARYVAINMAKNTGKKRGPKKGVPKPFKNPLGPGLSTRLKAAMARAGFVGPNGDTLNSALAAEINCTRQVIGQYLNAENSKRTIDAIILLRLCDRLWITPYWLVLNEGTIEDVEKDMIPMQEKRRRVTHR